MQIQNGTIVVENLIQDLTQMLVHTNCQDYSLRTQFHSEAVPNVTLEAYIRRIHKYTHCHASAFVIALIYLDRVQSFQSGIVLTSKCIFRFLITAVVVAIKFNEDHYRDNRYYAQVGGIHLSEMNLLENQFLRLVQFNLVVHPQQFDVYHSKLAHRD